MIPCLFVKQTYSEFKIFSLHVFSERERGRSRPKNGFYVISRFPNQSGYDIQEILDLAQVSRFFFFVFNSAFPIVASSVARGAFGTHFVVIGAFLLSASLK